MEMGSSMDMADATGTMSMTGDTTMASSTAAASMDMAGMHMPEDSCKISMLWNWDTVDACFISDSWRITSTGMFAGSCIGVICLVISLAFLRRVHRFYDAHISRAIRHQEAARSPETGLSSKSSSTIPSLSSAFKETDTSKVHKASLALQTVCLRRRASPLNMPTPLQQLVRALLYTAEFAVAYFVMLLAMYFNGYIIISILIGAFIGYLFFEWDTFQTYDSPRGDGMGPATEVTGCCG